MRTSIRPIGRRIGPGCLRLSLMILGLLTIIGCGQGQTRLTTNDVTGEWISDDGKIAYFTQENTFLVKAATSPRTLAKGGWFVIHRQRIIMYELAAEKRRWLQVEYLLPGQLQIASKSTIAGRWHKSNAEFPRDLW